MEHQQDIEDGGANIFATLPTVVWQRRWLILALMVIAGIGGAVAAWMIPPMYRSDATVLIESQQLPSDMLNATSVNDLIDRRIARARERVLSRQDLIRLIRTNNLYPEDQRSKPLSVIVDQMKSAAAIDAVSADLGGGAGRNTLALRIGFSYPDPVKAQIVAQQFTNRFLEVDANAQAEQAQGAATFLSESASQLASQIGDIEAQIRKIKQEHGTELALSNASSGNPAADATRIDGEIAVLLAQKAQARASGGEDGAVAAAEAALRIARARFSESHPDVVAAKAQLDAARADARGNAGLGPQLAAIDAQINSLRAAKGLMLSQSTQVRSAQQSGPLISDQIEQLEKREDVLRENLRSVSSKNQAALMAKRMEDEQKGERLQLADPPIVPDRPFRPNRPVIVAGAIAAGLAVGLGLTFLIELLTRPIRGTAALQAATGAMPLAIIPDYERRPSLLLRWLERRSRRKALRAG